MWSHDHLVKLLTCTVWSRGHHLRGQLRHHLHDFLDVVSFVLAWDSLSTLLAFDKVVNLVDFNLRWVALLTYHSLFTGLDALS